MGSEQLAPPIPLCGKLAVTPYGLSVILVVVKHIP
jgi:hypothetical protein